MSATATLPHAPATHTIPETEVPAPAPTLADAVVGTRVSILRTPGHPRWEKPGFKADGPHICFATVTAVGQYPSTASQPGGKVLWVDNFNWFDCATGLELNCQATSIALAE